MTQAHDHSYIVAVQRQLRRQPRRARLALGDLGLVGRRRAAHGSGHAGGDEPLAVPRCDRVRLSSQPAPPERGEQHVAAPVAGENTASPVPAVSSRGEAEDQDPRSFIPPARDRPAPVGLRLEGPALAERDLLPPGDKSLAGTADRFSGRKLADRACARSEFAHLGCGARDRGRWRRQVTRPAAAGRDGRLGVSHRRRSTRRCRPGCRARW